MTRFGLDGIGFALTKKTGIVAGDLDHCRDPATGLIEPWAQAIVDSFETYTDLSPTGTGLRLLVYGRLPGKGIKTARGELYDI
jgi:primase-polymerase (primpol)-like protein